MSNQQQQEPIRDLVELDKLIHEPRRFGIMNALDRAEEIGFGYLKRITGLSQGNLAAHLKKLEDAGMIEVRRRTILGKTLVRVYITEEGRKALKSHWESLQHLRQEVGYWEPSSEDDDLTDEEKKVLFGDNRKAEARREAG